ncbi:MAG: hypothetical protein NAG76_13480 [Candidatus Pristimantibacillus lignocellulolyticus]|uniref:Uncharacterized protein n=1 Tax=Candidatus Pristimantibacillus lignocellulolyticus TaxID=2994561 RepID=A0A9J6ZA14_9BACL|nr:MAG: hypothetical protein NAG76_13480 [Candidatus Pristimantibacillus lignocellulolyticus]
MAFIIVFITPIVAIMFFVNVVSLAKKIKKGDENTANNTGWGALMLGYIVFSIIISSGLFSN